MGWEGLRQQSQDPFYILLASFILGDCKNNKKSKIVRDRKVMKKTMLPSSVQELCWRLHRNYLQPSPSGCEANIECPKTELGKVARAVMAEKQSESRDSNSVLSAAGVHSPQSHTFFKNEALEGPIQNILRHSIKITGNQCQSNIFSRISHQIH